MRLKLVLSQTGQSWTLKPGRKYTIGTSPDCEISLPAETGLSEHFITLNYDENQRVWQGIDVSKGAGVYVDGSAIQEFSIDRNLKIDLAHKLVFTAVVEDAPKLATPPPMVPTPPHASALSNPYSEPPPPPSSFPSTYPQPMPNVSLLTTDSRTTTYPTQPPHSSYSLQQQPVLSSLPVLSWRDYINRQLYSKANGPEKLATWFYMTTGMRNTPWVKSFSADKESDNFNSFEGYIIPNFQGSVEKVISAVEQQLGKATRYEDTDCYVAELTDAHISNTLNQSLLKPEFFPIHRGSRPFPKGDYRRFCVTAYHRVRTYLLVEKYGEDVFVSWITRYEPEGSWIPMIFWLILASFFSLSSMAAGSPALFLLPLILWSEYFLLTPWIMQSAGILPNSANARILNFIIIPITFIVMGSWIGMNFMSQMSW